MPGVCMYLSENKSAICFSEKQKSRKSCLQNQLVGDDKVKCTDSSASHGFSL